MSSDNAFCTLGVPSALADILADLSITVPTPIQAETLPDSLAGRDVLGRGRTGSGKTFAFLLPLVARLSASSSRRQAKRPRALILAPTRELAIQIDESLAPLAAASGLLSKTVFGGVNQNPQVNAISRGVDVVVATPGRLEDLINQRHVSLDAVEVTIVDEADHMADLGFLPVVKRLLDQTPKRGQRMLFSATLDNAVHTLVDRYMHNPVIHEADSLEAPVGEMTHHVLNVTAESHLPVLVDLAAAPGRTIVFTRTKHRAKKIARQLNDAGVPAVELQGNLSQNARQRSMEAFHSGAAQTLVATDIAARGIHVDDVELVIHADPPVEHKAYLHRSGRTARAGHSGTVVTLMLDGQRNDVRDLTRKAGITPTITRVSGRANDPVLADIAPGEREFPGAFVIEGAGEQSSGQSGRRRAGSGSGQPRRSDSGSGRPQGGGRPQGAGRSRGQSRPAGARPAESRQGAARQGESPRQGESRQGGQRARSGRQAAPAGSSGGAASFSSGFGRARGSRH